jgi:phage baseplate assembly protein W
VTGPRFLDHPFHFDGQRRTATTDADDHVRDMIEQVLFTAPGERVNRPDFGCGLRRLVFMPNSDALRATTQFLVHGALQRWLSDLIQVQEVRIVAEDETIHVSASYLRLDTGQVVLDQFKSSLVGRA